MFFHINIENLTNEKPTANPSAEALESILTLSEEDCFIDNLIGKGMIYCKKLIPY